MADTEPHEVLGVARDAPEEEVRDAYREMVKEHHPDVSDADDAEERFVRIRDAYEVMRERAEEDVSADGEKPHTRGGKADSRSGGTGGVESANSSRSSRSEYKRENRERRKRWEDPWDDTDTDTGEDPEPEYVDDMGYGWRLFREDGSFFVSKRGGRGRVYIRDDGTPKKDKHRFSSREDAEAAYERYSKDREERRRTVSLGDGWRIVKRSNGYAVEGREGYLGIDGSLREEPYWFSSQEGAEKAYESHVEKEDEEDEKNTRTRTTTASSRVSPWARHSCRSLPQ